MFSNLRKWSRNLSWPQQLRFPHPLIALEGCGSGFNATNSIRTCLHFASNPPLFLGKTSFKDIQSLSVDDEEVAKRVIHCAETLDEARTIRVVNGKKRPVIAIENFVPGCVAVDGGETKSDLKRKEKFFENFGTFEFPKDALIVMGHENKGVSKETLQEADSVVYIPQFGTISSVNVVSCMGIMLFHYALIHHHQQNEDNDNIIIESRKAIAWIRRQLVQRVEEYQNCFQEKVPLTEDGTRVDPRPIHPSFFHQESSQIKSNIDKQIENTKTFREFFSEETSPPVLLEKLIQGTKSGIIPPLELSVFFEHFADQRNLGGLVRNANAFLATVLYAGRRRINKQGTVGSDNYTEIKFYGPMKDSQLLHRQKSDIEENVIIEYDDSTVSAIEKDESEIDTVWWLLDCSQKRLLAENDLKNYNEIVLKNIQVTIPLERSDLLLAEILKIRCNENFSATNGKPKRLILVVPPEAGLPCEFMLKKCSARITIFDHDHDQNQRGLPSQVASAIALHQLSPICLF
jgi:hypothetical protein